MRPVTPAAIKGRMADPRREVGGERDGRAPHVSG
jgi:hypothetical protein